MNLCPLDHGTDADDQPKQRNAAPGLVLCSGHRNRLGYDIADLPDLYDDLGERLHPTGPTLKPFSRGGGDIPTFINGDIADHRDLIWAGLSALARVVVEDRGIDGPTDSHPRVVALWLATHTEWVAAQPFADDEAVNLHDLVSRARALAYPSGRRRIELRMPDGTCARCVEVVGDVRCPGTLTATVARTDDLLPGHIRCGVCGTETGADGWLTLGRRIHREAS